MKATLKFLSIVLVVGVIAVATTPYAFGHGVGYETLPPQMLGDKKVAMEVNSIVDNSTGRREITFSLFDTNTGLTVRDVKYHVKTIKNDLVLFEKDHSTTNGVLVLDLVPDDSDKITTLEKSGDFFGSILGLGKNTIEAKGNIFKLGGLYKFSIDILGAENYLGKPTVRFEAGISFPESKVIQVNDERFGIQEIKAITYYELLTELDYDSKTNAIKFSMPFEWTASNINQTQVIHEEVAIPKTFGALQVSQYAATVNGIMLSNQSMTIDDFTSNNRIIHLLVYQSELLRLYEQNSNQHEMNFSIFPKSDDFLVVGSTDNVQYKLALSTVPKYVSPGEDVSFLFKIYDIFLHEKTVAVNYDLIIELDGKTLYKTSGKSTDTKDQWNEVKLAIPPDASDRIVLRFENLGDNALARTEIPILVVKQSTIPSWIKNNAGWWCTNSISDNDFLKGIEYLITKDVIQIPASNQKQSISTIPQWVKSNSCWWADGSISDDEFVDAIAFLVKIGLINP